MLFNAFSLIVAVGSSIPQTLAQTAAETPKNARNWRSVVVDDNDLLPLRLIIFNPSCTNSSSTAVHVFARFGLLPEAFMVVVSCCDAFVMVDHNMRQPMTGNPGVNLTPRTAGYVPAQNAQHITGDVLMAAAMRLWRFVQAKKKARTFISYGTLIEISYFY